MTARPSILVLPAVFLASAFGWTPLQAAPTEDARNHWAFRPLATVHPPAGHRHPVDAFIRTRLQQAGFAPAAPADSLTLLRRLHLDLHGLPPSPADHRAFEQALQDRKNRNEVSAQLIDRLLASPRYGERWAQHWLDLVRYADTHGFEVNTERSNAWPYRDYVIRALNEDRPYDQFIFEQLAGDSIGEDAATGFLVASAVLLPGQIGKDEASKRLARQDSLDEMIVATGDTFLGLSIGCARCHDHKFDPVSLRDYYAMQAFFAGVDYGERPLRNPAVAEELAAQRRELAVLHKRLADVEPLASTTRTIVIDDEDPQRTSHLRKKNGHGTNPPGKGRGYRDDPGSASHMPNLSSGRYTWWDNAPGQDVFTWNPDTAGEFRVWISWGVHGSGVHTRDARYVLDLDGDLMTQSDQREIARADQYYFAGVNDGESEKKPLWSGFRDAGVHRLRAESRVILRGGETGTGITADVLLLQRGDPDRDHPALRSPVDPRRNAEHFPPVEAKFVRFTSHATIENNKHEPCLDELEIFAAASGANVALDGTPTSSGNYSGGDLHKLEHINDGRYGNGRSWISNQAGKGWVQIELREPAVINRIVWGRDREENYTDRLSHRYTIEVAREPGEWQTIAHSEDRAPIGTPFDSAGALLRKLPGHAAQTVRRDLGALTKVESRIARLASRQMVYAGKFRPPDTTHVLHRGDPEQKLERVTPAIPPALGELALPRETTEQERRVALARWIAQSPLAARVMANRVWQFHFGQGLVETPSDFGMNGAPPSHPALLEWLAGELVRGKWSLKNLHRIILTSATYQQSNRIDLAAQIVDRECRLLWRFPSRRLEAEAIRDSILAVNGELNLEMGGPGFNFFKSRGGLDGFPIVESFAEDGLRRMIYAHKVRMERVPVFGAFDCPDAGQATPRRSQATTAIQALNLFNSKFVMEQAARFAARVQSDLHGRGSITEEVHHSFLLAFGRGPTPRELASSSRLVAEHGLTTLCRVLYNSNEFLFLP